MLLSLTPEMLYPVCNELRYFFLIFNRSLTLALPRTPSQSHHYAQLGSDLQKHFFAYSAFIMVTLKGSIDQSFNFSAASQNFIGGFNGPDLP